MPFNGRYRKGYRRILRELRREEAEARNALTPPERRSIKTAAGLEAAAQAHAQEETSE